MFYKVNFNTHCIQWIMTSLWHIPCANQWATKVIGWGNVAPPDHEMCLSPEYQIYSINTLKISIKYAELHLHIALSVLPCYLIQRLKQKEDNDSDEYTCFSSATLAQFHTECCSFCNTKHNVYNPTYPPESYIESE